MYIIYVDDTLTYAPNVTSLNKTCYGCQLDMLVNDPGTLTFTVTQDSPIYDSVTRKKSVVQLKNGAQQIFHGRVKSIERGWNNDKTITCEGDFAVINDYLIYADENNTYSHTGTLAEWIRIILSAYDTAIFSGMSSIVESYKLIYPGTITVTGNDDASGNPDNDTYELADITNPMDFMMDLVDKYGGYMVVSYKSGVKYLNFVNSYTEISTQYSDYDFSEACNQRIEFGSNLLALDEVMNSDELFTVLLPVGDDNLTLSGLYIVDSTAVSKYGVIEHTEKFEGVTTTTALENAGRAFLNKSLRNLESITLSAVDLSMIDSSKDGFALGAKVQVVSLPHSLYDEYVVTAVSIPLENPGEASYTFGEPQHTLTASMVRAATIKTVKATANKAAAVAEKTATTNATTDSPGLMSTTDKSKLDSLPTLTDAQRSKLLELLEE